MSSPYLEPAEELARLAGGVALRHYRGTLEVETKRDGSPVTLADRAAEMAARDWLANRFPADGVLGEEFGESPGTSGVRWLLDPIDGTKSFVRGVPLWGTLVSVVRGPEVLAGAAYYPALDEFLVAAAGAGCWWNGARARVSATTSLAEATLLVTDDRGFASTEQREWWRALSDQARISRSWGDCFGYLLVATGRADGMVDPIVNPWDIACFQPIVEEAGGVITDFAGVRDPFARSALATNAALADVVRGTLRA